jgi:hypothetical protein
MKKHHGVMLGVLVLGLGGAGMTGACAKSSGKLGTTSTGNGAQQPYACLIAIDEQCMRYHIPLAGNPQFDVALRNKYIAAFGSACYMSEVNTFDCFYKTWQTACADAVKIGEVSGNAPYDKGYACKPLVNGDYTLQVGPDVANKITINYQHAPRQTPLTDVNGTPTAVSGPYRNVTEPLTLGPGHDFKCAAIDNNGTQVTQVDRILDVNRKAHAGKVHSDLAGFTFKCKVNNIVTTCTEPDELEDPAGPSAAGWGTRAQVHHVVPKTDKRGCAWGTNSNKNAAVISQKLNAFLSNDNPPANEVSQLNKAAAYAP